MLRAQFRRKRGYMMIQLLLSLLILVVMLPLETAAVRVLLRHNYFTEAMQDEIGLAQMRRVLNICYDKQFDENRLSCVYHGEAIEFYCTENHLIAGPGTWIFLARVDEVRFFEEGSRIMMEYQRQNQWQRVVIAVA